MKAFVTGSTGFLGIHLLQELSNAGWEVIAFHRATSDLSDVRAIPRISYAVGDVLDKASIQRAMPEHVDAVFHAAGSVGFLKPGDEREQYAVNLEGTRNVVEVAIEKKVGRFIETSTVLTYDFSHGRRVTESSPRNAGIQYAYIHSKYLAELEVEKGILKGLDAVVLHPSAIFGAYDKATWSKVFREVQRGLHIPFAPPMRANLCHMRKVAQTHLTAFHKGRRCEHYILGGPEATMMEIATEIGKLLQRRGPLFVLPAPIFKCLGQIEYRLSTLLGKEPMVTPSMAEILCDVVLCDSSKAIHELDYDPSSLQVMLQDCYAWMVQARLLPAPENLPRQTAEVGLATR